MDSLVAMNTRDTLSDLLAALTTLTIATVNEAGEPCAAAVYYVHDESLSIYFLSAKTTVHGANMLARPRVAGTVHAEHQDWKTLRGIQLTGTAAPVALREFPAAALLYGRKYPFANLLKSADDPGALAKALSSTTLWKLVPDWIRLIDNGRGFGFKEEIRL